MPTAPAHEDALAAAQPARDIVSLACRAPSVHNTQPWRWHVDGAAITLEADRSRHLPRADPSARDLVISCGAALHHAQTAARALGWQADVRRVPDPERPDLLAQLDLRPRHRAEADVRDLQLLGRRRTDRRRFTSWPVDPGRLEVLSRSAAAWGAHAVPVTRPAARVSLEHLVARAHRLQTADPALLVEHRTWLDRDTPDGIRSALVPASIYETPASSRAPRFGRGHLEERTRLVPHSDSLLVLATDADDTLSWLRAGEALSALWLSAVREGLSVVPSSQVTEVPETRDALRLEVLGDVVVPQLLLRVGWQAIGRSELPASPRRPLTDVLGR